MGFKWGKRFDAARAEFYKWGKKFWEVCKWFGSSKLYSRAKDFMGILQQCKFSSITNNSFNVLLNLQRVLAAEFVDAYKISDVEKLKENGFSLAEIDTKLFEAFGEQIFRTGFVHADPHPGNGIDILNIFLKIV